MLTQTTLERLGRTLSAKYGIVVKCEGQRCYTDGKTIVLPDLPDSICTDKMLSLIRAYLDHEIGHIVGKSSPRILKGFAKKWGPGGAAVLNCLEDIRVETLMEEEWAGCGINLHRGNKAITERNTAKMLEGGMTPSLLSQVGAGLFAEGKGFGPIDYISDEAQELVEENASLARRCRDATSTADVAALTELVIRNVIEKEEKKKEEKKKQQAGQGQGEGEGEGEGEGQESSQGQGGGKGKKGGKSQKSDGKGESGDGNEGQGNQGDQKQQDSGNTGGGHGGKQGGDGGMTDVEREMRDEGAGHGDLDAAEALAKEVEQEASTAEYNEAGMREYGSDFGLVPVTPSLDTVEIVTEPPSHKEDATARAIRECSEKRAGVMGQKLYQLLKTEARSWWRPGLRRGKPDVRRLAQLACGTSDKVFRRRAEILAKDTACMLLVDGSGSMREGVGQGPSGTKGHWTYACEAMVAAAAFMRVLDRCRYPSMVAMFRHAGGWSSYTNTRDIKLYGRATEDNYPGSKPMRNYGIRLLVGKGWNTPARLAINNLAALAQKAGGGTPLGESIFCAANHLAKRPEERKVLLAFTDGYPNNEELVTKACEWAEMRGIEVVLIGIKHEGVRRLWPKHCVIENMEDLAANTVVELGKALGLNAFAEQKKRSA